MQTPLQSGVTERYVKVSCTEAEGPQPFSLGIKAAPRNGSFCSLHLHVSAYSLRLSFSDSAFAQER